MKNLFIIFILITAINAEIYRVDVSINPIQLAMGVKNFTFEHHFSKRFGLSLKYADTYYMFAIRDVSVNFYETSLSANFYNAHEKHYGLNYGPSVSLTHGNIYNFKTSESVTDFSALGISGRIGYKFLLKRFTLQPFGNFGYTITHDLFDNMNDSNEGDLNLIPIFWNVGINMGIALF